MNKILIPVISALLWITPSFLVGQENYEIQVYPAETIEAGYTGIELHSNFSTSGQGIIDDVRPTEHALRQTLELTHGFTPNFEIGFYQFINTQGGYGMQWVGTHLRPKISAPEKWKWPVGLALSAEIGYQRRAYSTDTWSIEIRPIIDKDFKIVYLSFNPVLGKPLKSSGESLPLDFNPSCKVAFHINQKIDFGAEYYGSLGPIFNPSKTQEQQHAIYAALDLDLHPDWELNLGTGWGLTQSTDGFIVKLIFGYKFGNKNKSIKG